MWLDPAIQSKPSTKSAVHFKNQLNLISSLYGHVILVTLSYTEGCRDVRTVVRRAKPNFLAHRGCHIYLPMVLCARALGE